MSVVKQAHDKGLKEQWGVRWKDLLRHSRLVGKDWPGPAIREICADGQETDKGASEPNYSASHEAYPHQVLVPNNE